MIQISYILILLTARIKCYIIFLKFNKFFFQKERKLDLRRRDTYAIIISNNSPILLILSVLHNDTHHWLVIKVRRSGRLICISPKCTAHIGIRGFRTIYETGFDGFTDRVCVVQSPAVSNLDASRPSWSLKDYYVAIVNKYLSRATYDFLFHYLLIFARKLRL